MPISQSKTHPAAPRSVLRIVNSNPPLHLGLWRAGAWQKDAGRGQGHLMGSPTPAGVLPSPDVGASTYTDASSV